MRDKARTGNLGEALARQHLLAKGYQIVEANWSTRLGELDIVARLGSALVFVEVKTRHSHSTEAALEGMTAAKRERLLKAAYQYLHERELDAEAGWRMDVIAVALGGPDGPRIDHVEDAFDW